MPFKTMFTKEEIIEAAFSIAQKDGLNAISARNVAKKMGSSVAPIYVNFKNIEALTIAVVEKVFSITEKIMLSQKGDNIYENMGKAGFEFADQYPVFFRDLVLTPNPYMASYENTEVSMLSLLDKDHIMKDWTFEERRLLILKMKVLQIGVAALVANKQMPTWISKQAFQDLLMELGNDLMDIEVEKRKKEKK